MRLNYFIKTLSLLITCNLYSQSYIVLDSITKEPISFVAVKFGENNGLYTNEKGMFSLNDKAKDSIHISCLGYFDYKESIFKLKDTIFLSSRLEILNEIVLSTKKKESFILGSFKKSMKINTTLNANIELINYIKPNPEHYNLIVEKIHLPIESYLPKSKKNNPINNRIGIFKINIYDANILPLEKKYSTEPIKFSISNKEEISVDISEYSLSLDENGICFGIEMIGFVDSNGDFDESNNSTYSMIRFATKPTNDFTSSTYFKYNFSGDERLDPVNELWKKYSDFKKDAFIKIRLTVSQ